MQTKDAGAVETPLPFRNRRKLAWWAYFVLALLILGLGIGGTYGVWYFSAKAELDDEIAKARRNYEPV